MFISNDLLKIFSHFSYFDFLLDLKLLGTSTLLTAWQGSIATISSRWNGIFKIMQYTRVCQNLEN